MKGLVSMLEEKNRGYVQDFKTVSDRSMMRFIFQDESRLIGYQLEMLKNNRIPSLLKCEVLKVDGEIRISYDITSLMPLKKILERKEIGRREFLQYLRQLTEAFDHLENHLLDFGGLMLDSSMIYGSPADDRIFFAYLPLADMAQDVNESLRQFITDLIIKEMKFKSEQADNYLQRLIEALKSPDFSLLTLRSWLDSLKEKEYGERTTPNPPQTLIKPDMPVPADNPLPFLKPDPVKPKMPDNRSACQTTVNEKKWVYPLKSWLVLGSTVIGILALFAVMILKGAFEPDNPDMLTTIAGLVLISGAAVWLVCSKVFMPDKKVEKTVEKRIQPPKIQLPQIPQKRTEAPVSSPSSRESERRRVVYVNQAIPQTAPQELPLRKSSAFAEAAGTTDRTVLLAPKDHAGPFLKRVGGDEETIWIKDWPFRIGRMAEQVDYCLRNPAVGRVHAELGKGPQGYFIMDMNTRNGTYINGTRIDPNTEHPIKSGDRIMLANEEFQFSE